MKKNVRKKEKERNIIIMDRDAPIIEARKAISHYSGHKTDERPGTEAEQQRHDEDLRRAFRSEKGPEEGSDLRWSIVVIIVIIVTVIDATSVVAGFVPSYQGRIIITSTRQ